MSEVATSLEGLTAEQKKKLLARLLAQRRQPQSFQPSFAQQRLWFLDQLEEGDGATYNNYIAVEARGRLQPAALERAFREVVRRHESLRTRFALEDGKPVQVVEKSLQVPLPLVDLAALAAADEQRAREEVERLAAVASRRTFDLTRLPLLRHTLVRLGGQEHVVLLSLHHIVSDGWSMGVLIHELGALYDAFVRGQESPLPPLPIQYVDFAQWQREHLEGGVLERQLSYWKEQLEALPVLELPTDRPRPPVQTLRGRTFVGELWPGDREALQSVGQVAGASLFMVGLAVFNLLLARYSGQRDIPVGTPVANRDRLELEGLIGLLINTLVLRTDLTGEPGFGELLERVRRTCVDAYGHQDLPFELLVDRLGIARDMSRPALAQVVFRLEPFRAEEQNLRDLVLQPVLADNDTAKFDLTLVLGESAKGYYVTLEYNSDLYDDVTARRMVAHYERLLLAVCQNPRESVWRLPMLSEEERAELLAWNPGGRELPASGLDRLPLHELFARWAERTPEAPAVTFRDRTVSYGDLDGAANRLAHRLLQLGVGPEVPVALLLDRGVEMVTAILAVLKAGGAYVPLDPAYPPQRLAFVVQDSGAALVITETALVGLLDAEEGSEELSAPRLVLDGEDLNSFPATAPATTAARESLAYVIYTSGSTGRPKGVLIPHSHAVDLFAATEPWFGPGPEDVWTLFHSFAFDFSVWELWGALLYGGRLVVVPYEVSRSPEAFLRLLRRQGVTMLSQTPSAFQALMREETGVREETGAADDRGEEPADHASLGLRAVVFGGEALEVRSLAPWVEGHGDAAPRLINMYGITETTVHVTYRRLRREDVAGKADPGIGEAIPDQSLRILEPDFFAAGAPSPVGVPGELCVGGGRLARGYLGRPGLTAQRFVPDPTSETLGARLYRSGDRGRYRADGSVEYLGRIDQQLKVRGFRIEAGEVEAALLEHPVVNAAVVVVQSEPGPSEAGGNARLVAYLVVPEGASPEVESQARELARERLPEYMVPTAYVRLAELPLTANGKVDRQRLPAPGAQSVVRGAVVPPKGAVEEKIAAVWAEVLGLAEVGAEDTFFDLGGHSLLMVQVHERLRRAFSRKLTMLDLFRHPTVASLAAFLEQTEGASADGASADGASAGGAPEPAAVGQGYSRAEQRKSSARRPSRRSGRRSGPAREEDG